MGKTVYVSLRCNECADVQNGYGADRERAAEHALSRHRYHFRRCRVPVEHMRLSENPPVFVLFQDDDSNSDTLPAEDDSSAG